MKKSTQVSNSENAQLEEKLLDLIPPDEESSSSSRNNDGEIKEGRNKSEEKIQPENDDGNLNLKD